VATLGSEIGPDPNILLKVITSQWVTLMDADEKLRVLDSAISGRALFISLFGASQTLGEEICQQTISVMLRELHGQEGRYLVGQELRCSFCGSVRDRQKLSTGVKAALICEDCVTLLATRSAKPTTSPTA